ncbi:MAG: MFS transporter [Thermoplasmata archaeon]|nr:MFS transporter [Thermoplasmata archaeon]
MTDASPARPASSHRLRAVFGATLFVRFGFGLSVAIFTSYIVGRSTGIDAESVGIVGLVSALAPVGEFSTVLLSGVAADRYGRFPVLFSGMIAAALLLAAASLTRTPLLLGGINLGFGVASGAILAASLAVVADEAGAGERGFEMGRFDAVNLLGWIGGFAVGFGLLGVLPNAELGRLFLGGSGLLGLGVVVGYLWTRGRPETGPRTEFDLVGILRTVFQKEVLIVTLPWLVIYLLLGTVFVFLGTAATGAGISPTILAVIIGGGGLLLLLTQPGFGRLADRFGRTRMMLVGTVGFVGVLVGASLLAQFGARPELLALVGISAVPALAYGPAALAALADLSQTIPRATTMAIYSLVISLGMLIGLLVSTGLYSRYQANGLDVYFGAIAIALVALTYWRYQEVRLHRTADGGPVEAPTTPAR